MASASASVVLTGKVRQTKIARDGTAVVVKKTLGDGTTLEERFPKRRMRGKRKDTAQMIPVEDVIRGMEAYAETIEPEVQRRVEGVNQWASGLIDREMSKEKKRTRYQAGKTAAAKQATRAARRMAGKYKQEANLQKGVADDLLAAEQRRVADSLRAKTAQFAAVRRRKPPPSRTAIGL
jgi:hypothetical protein